MPVTISQSDLARALQAVAPVVGRGHQPTAAAVRLDGRGDELVVSASSAEATIRHVAPLDSPGVGSAVVPARPLQRFVGSVTGAIALELRDDGLVASAGKVRVELRGIPLDTWTGVALPEGDRATLRADDVARVRGILHAAAPGAWNPMLAAIRLEPGWAVALDGYRLAAARVGDDIPACVVPVEIVTAAVGEPGPIDIVSDGRRVMLSAETTTYVSTTVAGIYPDWRQPIPVGRPAPHRLAAEKAELLTATRRAEALGFSAAGVSFTKVELAPSSATTIRVRAVDASVGQSDEEISGVLTLPQIAFNAQYLRQALEQATRQHVEFQLDEGTKPAVLDEDDHFQLVMPIRT